MFGNVWQCLAMQKRAPEKRPVYLQTFLPSNQSIWDLLLLCVMYIRSVCEGFLRLRPYHPEHARSRLISEAKQCRAWSVLGWETAWEYQVL